MCVLELNKLSEYGPKDPPYLLSCSVYAEYKSTGFSPCFLFIVQRIGTADIFTSQRRKSTGVTNNINDGSILIKYLIKSQ